MKQNIVPKKQSRAIHMPTATMLRLETLAAGWVVVLLAIAYLAWDLCQVHIALNRLKKDLHKTSQELQAMRMTLASNEQV